MTICKMKTRMAAIAIIFLLLLMEYLAVNLFVPGGIALTSLIKFLAMLPFVILSIFVPFIYG